MTTLPKDGILKFIWDHYKASSGPKRALYLLALIIAFILLSLIPIVGGWIDAFVNLLAGLDFLRRALAKGEAIAPIKLLALAIILAILIFALIKGIERFTHSPRLKNVLIFLSILCAISLVVVITRRLPNSPVTLNSKIAIAIPRSSRIRHDKFVEAVKRAEIATQRVAHSFPGKTARGARRRPPEVTVIELNNPSTAIEEILERLREEEFGYLVLAASPSELNYTNLLNALNDEVVTFIVRPLQLSGRERTRPVMLYPSPEAEGEWMARQFLKSNLTDIMLMYRDMEEVSDFETRCKDTFQTILSRTSNIHPSRVVPYQSEEEAKRYLQALQGSDLPSAVYIVDSTATQLSTLEALKEIGFRGETGLTSRVLDYIDPRTIPTRATSLTVPWPIELYLDKALKEGQILAEPEAEKETITGASVYSAMLISDFLHHDAQLLTRTEVDKKLIAVRDHFGDAELLPLGPVRFNLRRSLPQAEISMITWRKHDD